MIKFWHVARTYLRRPRFWIFGGMFFLLMPWLRPEGRGDLTMPVLLMTTISAVFACPLVVFIALHVRRQFGTPQTHLTPGFTGPHFAVPVLLTLLIWVAVPWIQAVRIGVTPLATISVHAVVAMLFAIVIFWPKLTVLLAVVPMLLIWPAQYSNIETSFVHRFVAGETTSVYAAMIVLGVLAYPAAAWRLKRLSDLTVAASDDFTLEPPGTALTRNPWTQLLNTWRDAHFEWRLARPARCFAAVEHRRLPSAPSWPGLVVFAALVLALVLVAWWGVGDPVGGWLVMTAGTGLMLFAPFSFWRFRASALGTELMRPATREAAVRNVMLAMAGDFCLWASVASITVIVGYCMFLGQDGFGMRGAGLHVVSLWSLSILLLGIGLATLRFRFWMPMFAAFFVASIAGMIATMSCVMLLLEGTQWSFAMYYVQFVLYLGGCAAIGLALAAFAYRRWRDMDVA